MRHVEGADSVVVHGEEPLESGWRRIFGIDRLSGCLPRSHNVSRFNGRCWETIMTQFCGGSCPNNIWLYQAFRQRISSLQHLIFGVRTWHLIFCRHQLTKTPANIWFCPKRPKVFRLFSNKHRSRQRLHLSVLPAAVFPSSLLLKTPNVCGFSFLCCQMHECWLSYRIAFNSSSHES